MANKPSLFPFAAASVLLISLLSTIPPTTPPAPPSLNPHIVIKPNPPKVGENVEVEIEWDFFQGDSIDLEISFEGAGSPIKLPLKKPTKGTIALPKGATKLIISDPTHQCDEIRAEITQ